MARHSPKLWLGGKAVLHTLPNPRLASYMLVESIGATPCQFRQENFTAVSTGIGGVSFVIPNLVECWLDTNPILLQGVKHPISKSGLFSLAGAKVLKSKSFCA
jgi:hypothetical protein